MFALVLYGGSALIHFGMWRWLRSVAPAFVARRRTLLVAVIVALFLLPIGRDVSILFPRVTGITSFAAFGMLWHITVWFSMAAVGAARAVFGLVALARKVRAKGVAAARPVDVERRRVLERIGGAAAFAVSGSALTWGSLRGRYEWTIEEVPIRLARLPRALDGFTIVQLSDLHVGTFVGERELALGLSLVDGLRPDLVVITGDIVDVDARFIPLAARRLGAL
jgi:hypothetical protein